MKLSLIKYFVPLLVLVFMSFACGNELNSQDNKSISYQTKNSGFPDAVGSVNDFENILSAEEEELLSSTIEQIKADASVEMVIVTVASIDPYDNLNEYSLALANHWGVGQKEENNGCLIALSAGLRNTRIQNGLGIEPRLSDSETKRIIDEVMVPRFKVAEYYKGLNEGIAAIAEKLK